MREEDQQAIEHARGLTQPTRRPTVAALEEILYVAQPVLDHGFVRVIDYMGDDGAIVQAARVSYGRGTTRVRDDRGLIRYLVRHRHTTPLEMCELKLHVKLPIFIARQWIRHRTANVNESSGRYSILDREFYLPRPEDLGFQSQSNRQGRGEAVPEELAQRVLQLLRDDALRCYDHYEEMLGAGLTRELARINLTLNYYTQWYWKIDLHNLMHFLRLRIDAHAQAEIRAYADVIAGVVEAWVPAAWEAFADYRLHGAEFSRQELQALRLLVRGQAADLEALGLSKREQEEFRKKLEQG